MKYPGIEVSGFLVPEFNLEPGRMVKLLVETESGDEKIASWGIKRMVEIVNRYNSLNIGQRIFLCPSKISFNWFDIIQPSEVGAYLQNRFGSQVKELETALSIFNIKPEYIIRRMGFAHQKLFSIICGIQENECIAINTSGLTPHSLNQLTTYIEGELAKGKSVICFDGLNYEQMNLQTTNIEKIRIKRVLKK